MTEWPIGSLDALRGFDMLMIMGLVPCHKILRALRLGDGLLAGGAVSACGWHGLRF